MASKRRKSKRKKSYDTRRLYKAAYGLPPRALVAAGKPSSPDYAKAFYEAWKKEHGAQGKKGKTMSAAKARRAAWRACPGVNKRTGRQKPGFRRVKGELCPVQDFGPSKKTLRRAKKAALRACAGINKRNLRPKKGFKFAAGHTCPQPVKAEVRAHGQLSPADVKHLFGARRRRRRR